MCPHLKKELTKKIFKKRELGSLYTYTINEPGHMAGVILKCRELHYIQEQKEELPFLDQHIYTWQKL